MRYFNTFGPCRPEEHYTVPPEPRVPEARPLIDQGHFFVVHAPRQTGKTTLLASLARTLMAEGRYVALQFSCEEAEPAGDDYGAAEAIVLAAISQAAIAGARLPEELAPPDPWPDAPAGSRLGAGLSAWAQRCPKPLVLFFDEIDALRGESLRSVLRQLRAGHTARPAPFPHSVILCGLRDVRDYRVASGGDPNRLGTASPFNVKIKSLRIGDFTEAEVKELYGQHTAETGQDFTSEALKRVFDYTGGQPWLVNALGWELTVKMGVRPPPITEAHVDDAKERLILARATHLDSLAAKLAEPPVQRVIEPMIAGEIPQAGPTYDDDLSYVRDLGLVAPGWPVRMANPIYQEVILRMLGEPTEAMVLADPRSFVGDDGRLDFGKVLAEFADLWREHGEVLERRDYYHEAAPQLVVMGFLHRIVNGDRLTCDYGIGWKRVDLCIRWPFTDGRGKRAEQREAVELKVWRGGRDPLDQGLKQLDQYLDRLGLDQGTLVIFDRREGQPPPYERTTFAEDRTPSGRLVTLLRA